MWNEIGMAKTETSPGFSAKSMVGVLDRMSRQPNSVLFVIEIDKMDSLRLHRAHV